MRLVQEAPSTNSEPMLLLQPTPNRAGRTTEVLHVQKTILLDQTAVASASVKRATSTEGTGITILFTQKGAKQFERVTGQNFQRRLTIVINGWVVIAPVIQAPIAGGTAQITGMFSDEEAAELAAKINDAVRRSD